MKTCPMILLLTWHNYGLLVSSQHDFRTATDIWEGVLSLLLRSLAGRAGIEKSSVLFKCLFERDGALIFLQVNELFADISKCLSHV